MESKDLALKRIQDLTEADFLYKAILSNPLNKGENLPKKIVVKNFESKNERFFQFQYFIGTKVIHKNFTSETKIFNQILDLMEENFKQCEIITKTCNFTILVNKKKLFKITGIKKLNPDLLENNNNLAHNKSKNYVLKEGEFYPWLYELGVIDKNGNVLSNKHKKFKQINKFLEMLDSIEEYLPENANIIDMGCGKSYLTFAIYHYFNEIKRKPVNIKGFDLKKDVVEHCNSLAKKLNFTNLEFFNEDISNLKHSKENIHMLITLHACDTATDYALFYAVNYNCNVILSVPCCQHELFKQVKNQDLNAMFSYGILKERFSSLLTDTLRAEALKLCGYKTSVMEFIDMDNTPKNIMIRAIKKENFKIDEKKIFEYEKLINNFNVKPKIYELLREFIKNKKNSL